VGRSCVPWPIQTDLSQILHVTVRTYQNEREGGAKGQEERKGLSMKIKDYIIQYFSTENQTCSSSQSIGMHN